MSFFQTNLDLIPQMFSLNSYVFMFIPLYLCILFRVSKVQNVLSPQWMVWFLIRIPSFPMFLQSYYSNNRPPPQATVQVLTTGSGGLYYFRTFYLPSQSQCSSFYPWWLSLLPWLCQKVSEKNTGFGCYLCGFETGSATYWPCDLCVLGTNKTKQ